MGKRKVKTYRIDPDEEALLKAGARREDLAPATFVRRAALERAARVVRGEADEDDAGDREAPNRGRGA